MKNGEQFYLDYINGNDYAFEDIMRLYYDPLVFFINSYTHSLSDAEDVASDCFLYIAIHKRKYNFKDCSLKTYLFIIARSKALNFLKKKVKKKTENIDDYTHLYSESEGVEKVIESKERNAQLYGAIDNLPDGLKSAVYLFYFEGMTYAQISKVTKMSVKQIDNALYKAKKLLKDYLKEVYV